MQLLIFHTFAVVAKLVSLSSSELLLFVPSKTYRFSDSGKNDTAKPRQSRAGKGHFFNAFLSFCQKEQLITLYKHRIIGLSRKNSALIHNNVDNSNKFRRFGRNRYSLYSAFEFFMLKYLIKKVVPAFPLFFGQLRLALFANSCAVAYRACIILSDTEKSLISE